MRKVLLLAVICLGFSGMYGQRKIELLSPDKAIKLELNISEKIYYSISYDKDILLKNNSLCLNLKDENLGLNPKLSKERRASVNEDRKSVV